MGWVKSLCGLILGLMRLGTHGKGRLGGWK